MGCFLEIKIFCPLATFSFVSFAKHDPPFTICTATLITRFYGTEHEKDLSEPPNCDGLGRVRHFVRQTSMGWPPNPLPLLTLYHSDPIIRRIFWAWVHNIHVGDMLGSELNFSLPVIQPSGEVVA
jgi:hypothetical protein